MSLDSGQARMTYLSASLNYYQPRFNRVFKQNLCYNHFMSEDLFESYARTPFNKPLIETEDEWNTFLRFKRRERDKVVRARFPIEKNEAGAYAVAEEIAEHAKGDRLIKELQERYGIAVPRVDTVVGYYARPEDKIGNFGKKFPGEPYIFKIVDRIYGKSLDRIHLSRKGARKAQAKFDQFYVALANYAWDKHQNGEEGLVDMFHGNNEQFMYGRRKGETEDRIFLVDVDPFVHPFNKDPKDVGRTFDILDHMLLNAEGKIGLTLNSAREKLQQYREALPAIQTNT